MATGTVTVTEKLTTSTVKSVVWNWLSTAAGAASETTTAAVDGLIEYVVFVPDGGGTQPTDQYDITITDSNSVDVLGGLGANLSNAANVYKARKDGLGAVAGSTLTLNVTNAGNAKGGIVVLYFR